MRLVAWPTATAAAVTVLEECNGGRRDGGGARHVDGGRSAGRVRRAAGIGRSARPERHNLDQTVCRRAAIPHHGQEPSGTFRGLWRHRRGGGHHRQTDQQEQRIWLCKSFLNKLRNFYLNLLSQPAINRATNSHETKA